MKKIFKTCSVYQRPEGFYLFGLLQTPYGGVTRAPATRLPPDATASQLGAATVALLGELSMQVVEINLAEAMAAYRQHLKDLGFQNTSAFERKASTISVHFDGEFYEVVSFEKDARGANLAGEARQLSPSSSAEEIGRAILAGLNRGHN